MIVVNCSKDVNLPFYTFFENIDEKYDSYVTFYDENGKDKAMFNISNISLINFYNTYFIVFTKFKDKYLYFNDSFKHVKLTCLES